MKEEHVDALLAAGLFAILFFFLFSKYREEVSSRIVKEGEMDERGYPPPKKFMVCAIPKALVGNRIKMCIDPDTGEEYPYSLLEQDGKIVHLEDTRPELVNRGKQINGLPVFFYR